VSGVSRDSPFRTPPQSPPRLSPPCPRRLFDHQHLFLWYQSLWHLLDALWRCVGALDAGRGICRGSGTGFLLSARVEMLDCFLRIWLSGSSSSISVCTHQFLYSFETECDTHRDGNNTLWLHDRRRPTGRERLPHSVVDDVDARRGAGSLCPSRREECARRGVGVGSRCVRAGGWEGDAVRFRSRL
jgi:hypothetical protein